MSKRNQPKLKEQKAVLAIRANLLAATRECFSKMGFTEVQGPILIPALGEHPSSFAVQYFDKIAYLSHGLQPYSDTILEMFQRIYTIAPVFRAEKAETNRHLCEYWHIESSAWNCNLQGIIAVQEELVKSICTSLSRDAEEELKSLGRNDALKEAAKTPFKRITYDQAIQSLQDEGEEIQWGGEITSELERKLSLKIKEPFFITDFPISQENLFFETNPEKPELSLVADLIAPEGYGEIASCGQAINRKSTFVERMREEQAEPQLLYWFLELKKFPSAPSAGFAMGVERLTQWVCGLDEIRKTTVFPRDFRSVYP
jgi:asparaginyl-tRNA synthetase